MSNKKGRIPLYKEEQHAYALRIPMSVYRVLKSSAKEAEESLHEVIIKILEKASGVFIGRGVTVTSLDRGKLWQVSMKAKAGDEVKPGQIVATVTATSTVLIWRW